MAKIELDLYYLKQYKIKCIADALNTTPSYIMGWDEKDEKANPALIQAKVKIAELIEHQYGKESKRKIARLYLS